MLKSSRFNEGVWCNVPEAVSPTPMRFKIRPLYSRQYLSMREKSKKGKVAVQMPDGKVQFADDYDESKFFWLSFSHLLEAWEGEYFKDIPEEEAREIIFNTPSLREFVNLKADEILKAQEKELEEELKNFVRSPSGSSDRNNSPAMSAGNGTT